MKKRGSLSYLTKEGFRNVWTNRLMSVASIAVLMACLVMMGSAFMVLVNVEGVMQEIEAENVVMVYLDMDATDSEVKRVEQEILETPNVLRCKYTSKESAFNEAIKDLETDATYFEGVENPLPDLFEVSISDMAKFDSTVTALEQIENVDIVRDNKEIADVLVQIRSSISYVSVGVIAVLLIISLFIISNTIRITMFNRRLEINIMKSVGATNWFIRWPFVVEGMLLGVISAFVSLGVVWGIYALLEPTVDSLLNMISKNFVVAEFIGYAPYILAAFVVIGILSGGIGSLISIQKYLKEHGGTVYDEAE
ncbi:MAG: permease-like cell division protein FtsX [Clostridia bacterium]|nr:permease-like cell division protein FtsX [Clostridia bacterium]